MTTRSASNALRDTVAAWIESLLVEPIDGGDDYEITARPRPPGPGDTVTYPMVAIVPTLAYRNRAPEEIPGSRSPTEGAGTYLELTGQLDGTIDLVIYANTEDQEDEVTGALESALMPDDDASASGVGRLATRGILLTADDYHDQPVRVARKSIRSAPFRETEAMAVWRPIITCDVAIPVVREKVSADMLPIVGLTVDDDGEYEIDIDEGTTTEP